VAIRIVRLGAPRTTDEGLRIGTVRRPPRGVPKAQYAARDFYDVWLPELAPSEALLKRIHGGDTDRDWRAFVRAYRKEMKQPQSQHLLGLLALMSRQTNLAVGCYCADEARCHRSILRELLTAHRAVVL
jgi:uncharacterized protein YeaO (DUF488 family)